MLAIPNGMFWTEKWEANMADCVVSVLDMRRALLTIKDGSAYRCIEIKECNHKRRL